jgi:hypothetical protein
MENVFSFRDRLIAEYSEFSRSFTRIAAEDIRGEVKRQCDAGRYRLWPERRAPNWGKAPLAIRV